MLSQTNPIDFLLNRKVESSAVTAPAFSLTKVLASATVVLTPLTALIVKYLTNATFSEWQIVVLVVGVLGFLAITASADVFARAKAISKPQGGDYITFDPPFKAILIKPGPDAKISIVAARQTGDDGRFLVHEEGQPVKWVARSDLKDPKGT